VSRLIAEQLDELGPRRDPPAVQALPDPGLTLSVVVVGESTLEVVHRDARSAHSHDPEHRVAAHSAFAGAVDRDTDRGFSDASGCARSVILVRSEIRRVAVLRIDAGADPEFAPRSYEVGRELAERGIGLAGRAGGHGLMRDVSQGALAAAARKSVSSALDDRARVGTGRPHRRA